MSEKHNRTVKQVIVWRNDLKVRKGKFAAQVAHASMAFLTKEGCIHMDYDEGPGKIRFENTTLQNPFEIHEWLTGGFTKIVCQCESEEELETLYLKAIDAGLNAHLITDSGFTEFHGVPTKTALAIGPNKIEEIDKITGHLKLM